MNAESANRRSRKTLGWGLRNRTTSGLGSLAELDREAQP